MKRSRKRSYFSYFSKTLAIMLAVTAAIGGTALYGKYQIRTDNTVMDCHSRLNALENWFSNPKNAEPSYADLRRELALCSTTDSAIDAAFILYDRETGKTYDSSRLILSSVRFQANNTKQIEKLKAAAPELAEQSAQDDGRYVINNIIEDPEQIQELTPLPEDKYAYSFRVHDVYICGDKAYPGKITIYSAKKPILDRLFKLDLLHAVNDWKELEHDRPSETECLHFSSENTVALPEDTIRADMLVYMPLGTAPDSPAMKEACRFMAFNQGDYSVSPEGEFHLENIPQTSVASAVSYSYYPDGKKDNARFEIYYIAFYNFWKEYLPRLLFYSGIIFLIELLIAALAAKILHMRYCKEYEMNEYRRSLTAALAHDLKSPLTVISGCAQNLRENIHAEKRADYTDAIIENAQYMDRIIADVLELAKLEQLPAAEKTKVDLAQLANVTAEHYAEQIAEKHLVFTCSGRFPVFCNERMLAQAIGNLIDNAVRYTPEGGTVTVTADAHSLTVQNDAAEIAEPEKLCEPLRKGDSARGARSGSGMGLAIVRQTMQLSGLRFAVRSENGKFTAIIQN